MTFEFQRVRFHFCCAGALYFPPGKAGNTARGAFGSILRKQVCPATYARIFEPQAAPGQGPSGLVNRPRPFVFRASHLDGCTIREGERFYFDVHLFDLRDDVLPHFIRAFTQLGEDGLGPGRALAELIAVDQLPAAVALGAHESAVARLRVRFVTPTELKGSRELVDRPEFAILFARLRDRISTLRSLYGPGPLEVDFRGMGERAEAIKMTRCEVTREAVERRSSRTGQRHPLGGFVGEAEYEGDLGEFVSYLRLGKWVGVGRQTVWGKGEIEVVD